MSVGFVSLLQIHTPQFFVGSKPPSCGINIDKPSPSSDLLLFINDYGVYTHVYPIPIILVNYVAYFAKYTPPKRGCLPPHNTNPTDNVVRIARNAPVVKGAHLLQPIAEDLEMPPARDLDIFGVGVWSPQPGQEQNWVQLTALTYQTWGLVASKMRFSQHN